jgi:hypothetical protein
MHKAGNLINAAARVLACASFCCIGFGSHADSKPPSSSGDSARQPPAAVDDSTRQPPAAADDPAPQPPAAVDDEVIVRGQTRADLRLQIKLAEDAVFARFNEINSSDDFDIHCRDEMPLGSRIPRRVCQANFWRDAQADAGTETVRQLQGGYSLDAQQFLAEALYKRTRLDEEMRRLAVEDEDLKEAIARLTTLEQAEAGGRLPRASLATASAEKTPGDVSLPYDAALEADVRMGRDAWTHTLRHHTFTIAHLYGQIRKMQVKCSEGTQRLRFQVGAEWTLPEDWGTCTLRVDAPLGTTFTLYEFQ